MQIRSSRAALRARLGVRGVGGVGGVGGAALLEALIALTIVLWVGLSMVGLIRAALANEVRVRDAELGLARADQTMTRMSLLPRPALDRRIGRHVAEEFIVNVQRPVRELYRIAVADTTTPDRELLITVVYRPVGTGR